MDQVLIAEPGELSEAQLVAAETLVRNAFGSSFRSHDWLHAVQGVHVTLTDGETLMAFAAVVARTLHHSGVAFDTGYVEGVAVRADQQGRGLGRVVMEHAETIIHTRHQLGALNAVETAADFYAARGWKPWTRHNHPRVRRCEPRRRSAPPQQLGGTQALRRGQGREEAGLR